MIERHKATGKTGVGNCKWLWNPRRSDCVPVFHMILTTFIVIGDNDQDMALAVQELIRTQGGYTLIVDEVQGNPKSPS